MVIVHKFCHSSENIHNLFSCNYNKDNNMSHVLHVLTTNIKDRLIAELHSLISFILFHERENIFLSHCFVGYWFRNSYVFYLSIKTTLQLQPRFKV